MKIRVLIIAVLLGMMINFLPGPAAAADEVWNGIMPAFNGSATFSGGNGSFEDPYLISTAADLAQLSANVNSGVDYNDVYFQMPDDIVLNADTSNYMNWDTAPPANTWTPIGTYTAISSDIDYPFKGTFDGDGHTVSGVYINVPATNYQGLFAWVVGGTINNLGITDSYIKGKIYIGGVAGTCDGGVIENCYYTGSISASGNAGGVVGQNNGTVQYCYNTGSLSGGSENCMGGVVGVNIGTIENSYNSGSVSSTGSNVGGVVGLIGSYLSPYTIKNSYNTGSVSGISSIGGVVGRNTGNAAVQDCYNTGSVSGTELVGGVVGMSRVSGGNPTVQYCYNSGSVSGTTDVGGVVGQNYGTTAEVTGCYYDRQMCPVGGIGVDEGEGSEAEGKLTSEMTSGIAFTGWDTAGTWTLTAGLYPLLTGMHETDAAAFVSVSPVFLEEPETAAKVDSNFTLSTANGVSWASSDDSVISVSGDTGTVEGDGTAVLTASLNGAAKNVILTVDITPPTLQSAARDTDTQITVTLSEPSRNLGKPNNGGFTVKKTGTDETFEVSGTAEGADASQVVLTVADIATAAVKGLTVTYTAGGNEKITDIAGNPMATDSTGVAIDPWAPKLGTPGTLSWDETTPAKATWGAAANASSYTVQLYKGGTACGSSVTGIANNYHDFTDVITETGSYTFTVQAMGNGTTYLDSDVSSPSSSYEYTALIKAAGVTIAAPAAGAEPAEVGSLTTGHASYTVTELTWQNNDSTAATLTAGGNSRPLQPIRQL